MRPRLIAIDLDGTLLGPGGVSDHDRRAIHEARAAGIEVVIATGRAWLESREALEAIGPQGVMVAAGGALLHDASDGRTRDRAVVDPRSSSGSRPPCSSTVTSCTSSRIRRPPASTTG